MACRLPRGHPEPAAGTCKHQWGFSEYCGAHICGNCGLHAHLTAHDCRAGRCDDQGVKVSQELARCYCGWNLAPGERLEDDVDL